MSLCELSLQTARRFEMRRELLTPQYTTCWKDLPKVRC
ncbi:DUF4113 domain-containing protein [Vibrio parahaemolyticus]|nr:DUF4113 domain-containing protein [Vibrio parahaemolyticus]EGQ8753696.1 DUF4113 domain-containing protein [Vibrio parahaemolyticus]EGQ8757511.1 DUF4113 domain-containing protein [Vibrio parahaemolyticus]EGQ8771796.1 DUF4113 domain-containing protein [Vibrio parahaemolyticus]EGQ8803876.1 DUF4113 domain-containing protein [Vibrio parahaemolyticus]